MKPCDYCENIQIERVGDSFDRADSWYCIKAKKMIDSYRDAKDGKPDLPKWCPLWSKK